MAKLRFPRVLASTAQDSPPPWAFGFQVNERYLDWNASAQTQLLKLTCATKLGMDLAEFEERLGELAALLPELSSKLAKMKVDLVCALLQDTQALAQRLALLRNLLPSIDVSELTAKSPALLLEYSSQELTERLDNLRTAFGERTDVDFLVAREPKLVRLASSPEAIKALLAYVERLPVSDPLGFVINNPSIVLDMDAHGLPSAIDGNLLW